MCVIPFVIILYMRSAFPEFMAVLYGNLAGTLFMTICLMVYLTAYQLGKNDTDRGVRDGMKTERKDIKRQYW